MSKRILTIALVIVFALALTLSLGGCKDKEDIDDDFDTEWEDDDFEEVDDDDAIDIEEDDENELVDFYEEGEWPDNEFTRQIPKPDFDVGFSFLTEDGFNTTFKGVTVDDARKYGELVQAAGFTINLDIYDFTNWEDVLRNDPETSDMSEEEIQEFLAEFEMDDLDSSEMYNFEAENSAGYYLDFFWSDNMEILLTITKL